MTQRYLQEDTDLTDWTVRSNSLFSNTNSDLTFNAQDSSGIAVLGNSYFKLPVGPSNERPPLAANGYFRFNTTTNYIEYYSGIQSAWITIASPPTITSISPLIISDSSAVGYDPSINIVGSNLGTISNPPTVTFIDVSNSSTDPSGNTYLSQSVTVVSNNQILNATIPTNVFDNSNLEPFKVNVQNSDTNLSVTSTDSFFINEVPVFTNALVQGIYYAVLTEQVDTGYTLAGELDLTATDVNHPLSDLTFSSTNITAINGGSLTLNSSTGAITGTLPAANRTQPGTAYSFDATVTDTSGGFSTRTFHFLTNNYADISNIDFDGQIDIAYSGGSFSPAGQTIITFKDTSSTAPGTTRLGNVRFNFSGTIDALLVGGGGSGGVSNGQGAGGDGSGGGGGGGGMVEVTNGSITGATSISIQVGAGGAAKSASTNGNIDAANALAQRGNPGDDTSMTGFTTASGGGGGGGCLDINSADGTGADVLAAEAASFGGDGGSGGGGGGQDSGGGTAHTTGTSPFIGGGSSTQSSAAASIGIGYGNAGGYGTTNTAGDMGGGGGGAGGAGTGATDATSAGSGGAGRSNNITGSSVTYAGGGGGGSNNTGYPPGSGGSGGGGQGGDDASNQQTAGTNFLGGGGGAPGGDALNPSVRPSAPGGSGVLIIKFNNTQSSITGFGT